MTARKITNTIIEMIDEGLLNERDVLIAALKYMSEDEVNEMAEANYFLEMFEDD